jgi:hypothetical protein
MFGPVRNQVSVGTSGSERMGRGGRVGEQCELRQGCACLSQLHHTNWHLSAVTAAPHSSLGFAGTMLLRSEEDVAHVKATGPLRMLAEVGVPWS